MSVKIVWMTAAAVSAAAWATPAFAADGGGSAGLVRFLEDAGFIGWVILALSVVLVALWIEYLVTLKRNTLLPPDILEELTETAGKGDAVEATRLCQESPGFFTNVVGAGLAHMSLGALQAGEAMQNVREEETAKLFAKIGWLKLIADVAPMLGLLGTVWGIMKAVGQYTTGLSNMQTFASQGIRLALITTLLGLMVAIVATSVYFFFRTRLTRLSIEVGEKAEEVVLQVARGPQKGSA